LSCIWINTVFNWIWTKTVSAITNPSLTAKTPNSTLSSYWPISLTSIPAKTMDKMIRAWVNWYLKTQNLLPLAQGGFRRYCSTNQQITMLSQENCFDKREKNNSSFCWF
jgi:hypothetical protein